MDFVTVTTAQVLGHYRLRVGFSDGSSRDVDLKGELHGPVFEPLADPDYFAQVRVDNKLGTVVWPSSLGFDAEGASWFEHLGRGLEDAPLYRGRPACHRRPS